MPESGASSLVRWTRRGATVGLALMVIGPSILLVYAWVEVLNNPGVSLVDGYWIGRLPWIPLGIIVGLAGVGIGLISAGIAITIVGGWWRRALVVAAYVAAGVWWSTAAGWLPLPRFHGPDPVGLAYDLPVAAALLLLMPAALIAVIALTPRPPSAPRTRLRPVARREPWSETPHDAEA
jgi:hypothetical protein